MPISEKGHITQHGINIGYSDTFAKLHTDGDLTVEELIKYSWCASEEPYINALSSTDINVGTQQGAATTSMLSYIQRTSAQSDYDYKFSYINDRLATGKPYSFNILVYAEDGNDYNAFNINSDNSSKYRLVTSIEIQKIYAYISEVNKRPITYNLPVSGSIDQYYSDTYPRLKSTIDDGDIYVYPMTVYVIGESFYISVGSCFAGNRLPYEGSMSDNFYSVQYDYIPEQNAWLTDMTYRCSYGVLTNYEKDTFLLRWAGNDLDNFISESNNRNNVNYYQYSDDIGIFIKADYAVTTFTWYMFVQTENAIYNLLALMGLKCKFQTGEHINDTLIPIISNTMITGYTFDATAETEFNNITDVTGNNIQPIPPSPIGGDNENEEIEMPLAYIGGTGGFVQFIKINSAGLASADDISAALSRFDITTIGKDLLRNFVSYKCFAVLNIDPNDTVTRQIKVDGHALTDENDQPLNGQVIGSVLPIDFTIGTPTRYFNDFRDFAPYTKIEAYVPFCGWFSLPPWCIGHKITGTMFTDLYNGTVKAVIFAGQTVVAEVGGCCAYDIPFVADATGAKAGAVISSALSTAAATAATVSIPNVATGISAVTSAANTICAINSNDTTLKGVLGDGSNLNGLLHCYLKVTRPQSPTRTNVIPDTYKHEIGIPTCKELTLTAGDGYTQIMDANIEGSMTAREKQMIIDGFRHGLIL